MIEAWVASSTWPSPTAPRVGEPNSVAQICLAPSPLSTIIWRTAGVLYHGRGLEHGCEGVHGYEYGCQLRTSKYPWAPNEYIWPKKMSPAVPCCPLRIAFWAPRPPVS